MYAPLPDGVSVRPWTKADRSRLYVNGPTGHGTGEWGWVDLRDGTVTAKLPSVPASEVYRLASMWAVANAHPCPPARQLRDAITPTVDDTATRTAGSGLRALTRRGSRTDRRSWRVGAAGEKRVGKTLDTLADTNVLHNVQVGSNGADIDHVVFSPTAGVVVVSTKHHPDATVTVATSGVRVGRTAVPHLPQLAMQVDLVANRLSRAAGTVIPVAGVLAVVCGRLQVTGWPGMPVLEPGQLTDWFATRTTGHTREQLDWLYATGRVPNTWLS